MKSSHANRGRSLESMVLTSQLNHVCLAKIPNGVRYIGGESVKLENGKNRWIPRTIGTQTPCDFMGVICKTGQAIAFEAKQCQLVRAFRVECKEFPRHQRDFLCRMGAAGAVAGAVIEAVAFGKFLWLDWRYLARIADCPWPTIPWTHGAWFDLGSTSGLIRFGELVNSVWTHEEDEPAPVDAPLFACTGGR